MRPCARRSASQVASFTSVLRPGTALTWAALARASARSVSSHSTAQTGFQYTPVASITACVTPWLFSHADKRSRSAVVVANVSTWRTTRAPSAMRAAGHDTVLVDVEAGAAGMQNLHGHLPCGSAVAGG